MKKLLLAVLLLAVGIALALLLRRPPPAHIYTATIPVIRKSAHDIAPIKHVTTVPGMYAGHHHGATKK
ncbi:hypothetical protein [Hymenobacter wooponensis]|uniref:Uncharacterized protein n=1 Tax=Hymenobacter wooponensis TaxID=1525360 RepID=A0A4Z0MMN7_9BACT|nr:hypothetical protein [Hymenobacter wooponensis]TGD80507.1 hypothetical protein EU557_11780 [Hymenobacter wooponensis]